MLPLDSLKTLDLVNTNISDDITSFLDSCPKLHYISIKNFKDGFNGSAHGIRCDFIRDMAHPKKVTTIDVSGVELNDDILKSINRFENLRKLTIVNGKITERSKPLLEIIANRVLVCIETDDSISGKTIFSFSNNPETLPGEN